MQPTTVRLTIPDSVDPSLLMGPSDVYLRRIEESFDALVTVRGSQVTLIGAADAVEQATGVFSSLIQLIEQGEIPTLSDVELSIGRSRLGAQTTVSSDFDILLTYRGRAIRPKTPGSESGGTGWTATSPRKASRPTLTG